MNEYDINMCRDVSKIFSRLELTILVYNYQPKGFPGDSEVKNLPAKEGDAGSVPGSGRSSGGGHGNPL